MPSKFELNAEITHTQSQAAEKNSNAMRIEMDEMFNECCEIMSEKTQSQTQLRTQKLLQMRKQIDHQSRRKFFTLFPWMCASSLLPASRGHCAPEHNPTARDSIEDLVVLEPFFPLATERENPPLDRALAVCSKRRKQAFY